MSIVNNKLSNSSENHLTNSVVLITGAGGTIGCELVKRIEAKLIIAVDISEYAIYKLQREIHGRNIHCIVGDVSDSKLVDMIFEKYKIDYVLNAAAYKHVDTLEDENNSYSVIKNNILSVINLCNRATNIRSLIHISSDKAVNPINNMGFTKLWCERIIQHFSILMPTEFKIVRFGNIFRSSGSFIETMQWQMENNLPITITDPNMKRYFITVQDATALIIKVVTLDRSQSTYILDMGKEMPIMDFVPKNYPYKIIGIRPGEKISEELIYSHEILENTEHPMIKRVDWNFVPMEDNIDKLLKELKKDKICLKTLNEIITTTTIL